MIYSADGATVIDAHLTDMKKYVDQATNNAVRYIENSVNVVLPSTANWMSICYGNGKFVAVDSDNNVAAYSTDGIAWTQITMPIGAAWTSVCYGNDKFVAVSGDSNVAAYSTDGITWTQTTMPVNEKWYSVCYGNGKFVAVVNNSNIAAYSTDGITWTQTTLPTDASWASVCYGMDKFVAVDSGSNVAAYSTDGIAWTQIVPPTEGSWMSVCYGNGKFVAVDVLNGIAIYSTDGITWTQITMPIKAVWASVCYGNGKFVTIAHESNIAAYSTDGINWTQTTLPASKEWYSVCYGDGKFVAVALNSDIAAYSTDGITWLNTITTRELQNAAGEDISEDVKEAIGAATETDVTQALTDAKAYTDAHSANKSNPHGVTAEQIGAAQLNHVPYINDNSDLNTYLKTGTFACGANDSAKTLKNVPTTQAFVLTVGTTTGGDAGGIVDSALYAYIYQKIVDLGANVYYRYIHKNDGNLSFGQWRRLTTTDDISYGTADLTAGSSALETGKLYFVYE